MIVHLRFTLPYFHHGVGVVGIGVGVDGVREGSAATPGLELLEIGIGMEDSALLARFILLASIWPHHLDSVCGAYYSSSLRSRKGNCVELDGSPPHPPPPPGGTSQHKNTHSINYFLYDCISYLFYIFELFLNFSTYFNIVLYLTICYYMSFIYFEIVLYSSYITIWLVDIFILTYDLSTVTFSILILTYDL